MKLSNIAVDHVAVEQGAWIDNIPEMGDLRLKVRGVGNADWRRIQATLIKAVPRKSRMNGVDTEEQDRITGVCLQSACLLDWENLHGDDGTPLAFSKDIARDLLTKPEYRSFRDAVLWAATVVGEHTADELKADAKNLSTP